MLDRRRFLISSLAACASLTLLPRLVLAAGMDPAQRPRMVLVILRGALDGLHAVPPVGDPDYAILRGKFALSLEGEGAALPLDSTFALHPALRSMHGLWKEKQLAIVHAVATPYRSRSHFDAQDVLENGGTRAHANMDGWLNRALISLPHAGAGERGVAVGGNLPLVLRGDTPVGNWSPSVLPGPAPDFLDRIRHLYAKDAAMAGALERAHELQSVAAGEVGLDADGNKAPLQKISLAQAAARFLTDPNGPSVAVLELGGWDSHIGQFKSNGELARSLRSLDNSLAALRVGLGPAWDQTAVLIATEFGRTARPNGSGGTDHGTGAAAFITGGAVNGGRVLGQWPGLKPADLFENRDLRPTTDLRSVAKGLLLDHLRVPESRIETAAFPDSANALALRGLVRRV